MNESPNHDEIEQRLSDYHARLRRAAQPLRRPDATARIMAQLSQRITSLQISEAPMDPSTLEISSPKPRSSGRGRGPRIISGVAALAAVLALALVANALFAHYPRTSGTPGTTGISPTATAQSNPVGPVTQDSLDDVSMVSATEGWAVGRHTSTTQQGINESSVYAPLLYHYTNGTWRPVTLSAFPPSQTMQGLGPVSMVNAHDGWAGGTANNHALLLHYDGTAWQSVPLLLQGSIDGIDMVSANEGWAITGGVTTQQPAILHYLYGVWSVQYSLPRASSNGNGSLNHLTMISATEGWAVGTTYTNDSKGTSIAGGIPAGVILHYRNGSWSVQATYPTISLTTISMSSAVDGWAAGLSGDTSALYHYTNGNWQRYTGALPLPKIHASVDANAIFMTSATDGWLADVGHYEDLGNEYIYHYDGSSWNLVRIPLTDRYGSGIGAFAFLPGGEGWAVGSAFTIDVGNNSSSNRLFPMAPLILHYTNGAWSQQSS
jgi:hypothetical protein